VPQPLRRVAVTGATSAVLRIGGAGPLGLASRRLVAASALRRRRHQHASPARRGAALDGVYEVRLVVYDDDGATDTDTVRVVVDPGGV